LFCSRLIFPWPMLFKPFLGVRRLFFVGLLLSAVGFSTACGEDPPRAVVIDPTAAAGPTAIPLLPTPTLAAGVPTPPLPTPLITRTVEGEPAPSTGSEVQESSTPSPTPSATPELGERLDLAQSALAYGDYDTAVEHFSASLKQDPQLETEAQEDVLFSLGVAYLADEQYGDAATMFHQLLTLPGGDPPTAAHFHLAQASVPLGDYEVALEEYQAYLAANPDMAAYVQPLIAEVHLALGDSEAALQAYEAALEGPSNRFKEVGTRLIIAGYYLDAAEYAQAIAQYDAIHDLAQTEVTRGQMTYLAGAAELQAGNLDAAYERFLFGVETYPAAYESYLGLVELVKAEKEVDSFQRGLVDYLAAAYAPGIPAFAEHISANPDEYDPESHRYLALSHEALGDLEAALAELDLYAAFEPAQALLEKARMQERAGEMETAAALFQQFLDEYPQEEDAPAAAWWLARRLEQLEDNEGAVARYVQLADDYPDHPDAAQALYNAGWLAQGLESAELGISLWQRAAEAYPDTRFGSAAMVHLLRLEPEEGSELMLALEGLIANNKSDHYYALRAADIIAGVEPFDPSVEFALPDGEDEEAWELAEAWVLEQEGIERADLEGEPGELGPELSADERLLVGQKLWKLGLREEAKQELENLRSDYNTSLLDSYRLALFFRDLGLYRSSIIAASTVLNLAGESTLTAPRAIGRLAYPTYYADHILPLAEEYGYDPRLQFSLVRQESLFESFARSGAAAQGLSQVIPDTGAWIANRLQWPGYVNEDLYKPYVGLTFGAYYLAEQLEAFDGDVHAALAAYNAGPGNAARWYAEAGSDIDQFVDVIDFAETKAYVERIYAGFDIYRYLYGP
jgi:soluble lytic murein transglycosylase